MNAGLGGEDKHGDARADAVGTLTDLADGQVLLPSFIEACDGGLFVDPEPALAEHAFQQFVERMFTAGARFAGLEYEVFLNLLYGLSDLLPVPIKVADAIVAFPPERSKLYRPVKIDSDGMAAEYVFEPIEIEVEESVPLYGTPDEAGNAPIVGYEGRTVSVPARLDFDEFVAAMWEKGVRFGIDARLVREMIDSRQVARLTVARALQPTLGQDASIEEKTEALHRDNAPKILPDGRMDLRQFKNRFPQISADAKLLQKIPRRLGKPGRNVAGKVLEPDVPQDFDITPLAGPGTRVEVGAAGEFIVAARDGFINIDSQTNQISVTEKIVSHDGVSMKATGDVVLTGDEFEEHGEVQERRVVEGHHMTFFANVYGNVVSRGGRIVLKAGIAGGQATSPGGSIVVEGRASRATLEARGGEIVVEFAEGCAIVASKVSVTHAVNCDILGEAVTVELSEGCAIAGKAIHIAKSTTRKDTETIVAILTPDMTRHERDVVDLEQQQSDAEQKLAAIDARIAQMMADNEFKQFLVLAATIAKGGAKLSAAHEARWQQTQTKFAPVMREWHALQKEQALARKNLQALLEELAALADKKSHAGDGIACAIAEIQGDTLVRRMAYQPDQSVIGGAQAREIAAHLREFGISSDRLFWASSGAFSWSLEQALAAQEGAVGGEA